MPLEWAGFHIAECMSSSDGNIKRIGYHAAAFAFNHQTDKDGIVMLVTQTLRKDMQSGNVRLSSEIPSHLQYLTTTLPLHLLAQIMTPSLALDLASSMHSLLTHSRTHIRKRVLIVLLRTWRVNPEAVDWDKIRALLNDNDQGVREMTVTVMLEVAVESPDVVLTSVTRLHEMLTQEGTSTWMLIKLVQIVSVGCLFLTPRCTVHEADSA